MHFTLARLDQEHEKTFYRYTLFSQFVLDYMNTPLSMPKCGLWYIQRGPQHEKCVSNMINHMMLP
jgi:hypothetical protein